MRLRSAVPWMLLVTALVIFAPRARAAPLPGEARLHGWLGFTTLRLNDPNGQIRADRAIIQADTLVDEYAWDPLGGEPRLAVEVDVRLTQLLSAGIGFSTHRGSVRHEAVLLSYDFGPEEPSGIESFDETLKISAWDVVGTLGLWVPSAPGLHFGAQLGLVRGTIERERMWLIDKLNIEPNMRLDEGTWRGTGLVLGAFTGYEQPVTPQLSVLSRIGYSYRRIGPPQGTLIITEWGDQGNAREWERGPLRSWEFRPLGEDEGEPMKLDLGGFYVNVGISLALGGGS